MPSPSHDPVSTKPEAGKTRCGFVALLGAPNAGKSTLLNNLIGAKVSIVTPKVQTTRTRVLGICILDETQLVIVDTPGIFAPRRRLDRAMVAAAWQGAGDADAVVLLVDAERTAAGGLDGDTRRIMDGLERSGRHAILALNKIDLVKRDRLLALVETLNASGLFTDTFLIAAINGDGVGDLRDHLARSMPEGPWLYPEDQLSDMPQRLLAAEITREQLFLQLHQELPYALTVETEEWDSAPDGSVLALDVGINGPSIIRVLPNGSQAVVSRGQLFIDGLQDLSIAPSGQVFVTESLNSSVIRVDPTEPFDSTR